MSRGAIAGVLAEHRVDPRQTESAVDVVFALASDDLARRLLGEGVLVERQAPLERALSQADVVPLAAREVEQGRAELDGRDDPHVDLQALLADEAELRLAAGEHGVDERHGEHALHHGRGVVGTDDDVEIADRLAEAPQTPAVGRSGNARHAGELRDDALRQRQGDGDGCSPAGSVAQRPLERLAQLLLGAGAEPG